MNNKTVHVFLSLSQSTTKKSSDYLLPTRVLRNITKNLSFYKFSQSFERLNKPKEEQSKLSIKIK